MRKSIKAYAILLSLLMVIAMFAGYQTDKPAATPSAAPTSAASQAPAEENPSGLPYPRLTEETVEVSVWQTFTADYIASMNDSEFVNYVEELTGIRFTFKEASAADATTAYNLMINSGDYTDIVRPGTIEYPGGPDKAVQDGVYLRLNELIDKVAPNYAAKRTVNESTARQTVTDAGNIWSMYTLNDPAEYPWNGLALRGDILEKKGVALPVTLADWETALQAFVDEGVKYPLLFDVTGVSLNSEFLSAYQIGKEFYQKDGKVYFGYTQPEFKEYLTMMNKWYGKGYLDKDFTSHGVTFAIFAGDAFTFTMNGDGAAGLYPWGYTANAKAIDGTAKPEGFYMSAVSAPVMNAGDTIHFRYTSYEAKVPNAITTACENPELVIKLLDYFYTEEGERLVNYGKEGVSYNLVDGLPRYSDDILHNPDGFLPRSVAMKYAWDDGIGMGQFKRLWQAYEGTPAEAALEAYNTWNKDSNDYLLPQITRTAEEGEEYSALYGDIKTYATETIPQFITGAKPLSEFDAFIAQIKSMNIDRCIEINQAALDRYLAR